MKFNNCLIKEEWNLKLVNNKNGVNFEKIKPSNIKLKIYIFFIDKIILFLIKDYKKSILAFEIFIKEIY